MWPPETAEADLVRKLVAMIAERVHKNGDSERGRDRKEWEDIKARVNGLQWRLEQIERALKPKKKPARKPAKRKARKH